MHSIVASLLTVFRFGIQPCALLERLNIDDDLLIAVKEVAKRESKSAGAVVSDLLRQSLAHQFGTGPGLEIGSKRRSPEPSSAFVRFPSGAFSSPTNVREDRAAPHSRRDGRLMRALLDRGAGERPDSLASFAPDDGGSFTKKLNHLRNYSRTESIKSMTYGQVASSQKVLNTMTALAAEVAVLLVSVLGRPVFERIAMVTTAAHIPPSLARSASSVPSDAACRRRILIVSVRSFPNPIPGFDKHRIDHGAERLRVPFQAAQAKQIDCVTLLSLWAKLYSLRVIEKSPSRSSWLQLPVMESPSSWPSIM